MLIPQLTTIRVEDFDSDQQKWIGKLLLPLNQFLLSATSAINGNITYTDNIPCVTWTLNFTYGAQTDFPRILKYTLPKSPVELRICSATEAGAAIAVIPSWSYANNQVNLTNLYKITSTGVTTLTSGVLYNIVIRVQP